MIARAARAIRIVLGSVFSWCWVVGILWLIPNFFFADAMLHQPLFGVSWWIALAIGAFFGLVVGVRDAIRFQEHLDAAPTTAGALGLQLLDEDLEILDRYEGLRSMSLFQDTERISSVMSGVLNSNWFAIFDLTTKSTDDGSTRTNQSTVAILPNIGLSEFKVYPANPMLRTIEQLVEIPQPSFDPAVYDHSRMAELLESFQQHYLVMVEGGKHPEVIPQFSAEVIQLLVAWPGWVVESKWRHLAFSRSSEEDGNFVPMSDRGTMVGEITALGRAFLDSPNSVPLFQGSRPVDRIPPRSAMGLVGAIIGFFLGWVIIMLIFFQTKSVASFFLFPLLGIVPIIGYFVGASSARFRSATKH